MIGAVLAGGEGRRLRGGSKPATMLAGRPLASYAVQALEGVCEQVAVVCKPDTELPDLGEAVERWDEPAWPRHPLAGIVHALERAGGPVLVCAADMPFVTPDACRTLLSAAGAAGGSAAGAAGGSAAVVAAAEGVLQPVFGLYGPAALGPFKEAPEDAPLTRTVEALDPVRVALPPALVRSVNTPEDLAEAEDLMAGSA
jgi:molybdopterin-guanine dinucleotide biosynthesis protein A